MHGGWSFPFLFRTKKHVSLGAHPPPPPKKENAGTGEIEVPRFPSIRSLAGLGIRPGFLKSTWGWGLPSQMQRGPCLIALQLEGSPPLLSKKILFGLFPRGHAEVRAVGAASPSGGPGLQTLPAESIFQAPSSVTRRGPMEDIDMRCRA